MGKKPNTAIIRIIIVATFLSIAFTYWRTIILKDFIILPTENSEATSPQ